MPVCGERNRDELLVCAYPNPGAIMKQLMLFCLTVSLAGCSWVVGDDTRESRARNEILELSEAVKSFRQHFGMFPPSTLTVPPSDPQSKAFLQKCFPLAGPAAFSRLGVNGELTGDQLLVLCLGGVQSGSNNAGI